MKHEELDEALDSFGDALASATRVTPGNALRPEDIAVDGVKPSEEVAQYALTLGDDALILAQRMSHWISRAPELEEDVALGNIALDVLGHARSFLTYAGLAWDKTEDDLAYWREEEEFTSLWIVEQPNGHFGVTIIRQLIVSIFQNLLYKQLTESKDETLAAISAKAVKEVDYHRDHAIQWTIRLGQGTEESAAKMRHALEILWPYVDEMFRDEEVHQNLEGIAVLPSTLRSAWEEEITAVLDAAGLEIPSTGQAMAYGRRGEHSEHLGYLLAEMQVLARKHPGASW
ncbi:MULTISPECIES: 1,2-phenylacetyl-CoA epoxidase subunit PaaC [Glutamicibacter]|uniref:1,2-phenylacetyl-CoA epoxidase subunit PaaC n=1 Tax=Glutamicibacter TaxID=1742989 RepID=UPI00057996E0|nr:MULTISPECIES: 1,2-phenylacetyl-CoA epoxidase subunit PaaC [Glutamicibacter]KWR70820.1 phenylacetate-CoA oxygenase [Arthrobacter sp. W1]QEP07893.1 phenylacetate-CoA oxygenase subunit PaaC [Glutamicibacter sp. ZJUTW]UTM46553.1 phenylacetate-CoA oxygenase subunit PaaC [Glutamicibacter mysorens]WIV43094.1 1,2-phenylacetyl-CoA epoxidase subunit PaaC [Glutamicibacter nicotianae]